MKNIDSDENIELMKSRLASLNKDKLFFETRLLELTRIKNRNKSKSIKEDSRALLYIMDQIYPLIGDLVTYIKHLDEEIAKVTKGYEAIVSKSQHDLEKSFIDYMLEDTRISLKHTAIYRFDFDQIIKELKAVEKDVSS